MANIVFAGNVASELALHVFHDKIPFKIHAGDYRDVDLLVFCWDFTVGSTGYQEEIERITSQMGWSNAICAFTTRYVDRAKYIIMINFKQALENLYVDRQVIDSIPFVFNNDILAIQLNCKRRCTKEYSPLLHKYFLCNSPSAYKALK